MIHHKSRTQGDLGPGLEYSCEPFGKSRNMSEGARLQVHHIAEGLQVLVVNLSKG